MSSLWAHVDEGQIIFYFFLLFYSKNVKSDNIIVKDSNDCGQL